MSVHDSITLEAAAPRPGSSLAPARLLELLLTPRSYFANRGFLQDQRGVMIAAYVTGASGVMDRIDQKLLRADLSTATAQGNGFLAWILESWLNYWILVLGFGVFGAALTWRLGGWWYKKRLHWSGAEMATPHDARRVNVLQQLVFTGPAVALALIQSALYQNYREVWHSDNSASMLILGLMFWSCWTSYCAATTVFPVEKSKARIWFLALPIVVYMMAVGVVGAAVAMLTK
jgi:hypothetical protein